MSWTPGALLSLTTERFELRTMTREDVTEELLTWLADPEVMAGLNLPRQRLSRVQAVRWVLSHDNQQRFFLAICPREASAPVGFFTISCNVGHETADTSVVIGNRDWWGQNVVVECRSAILDFLFDEMGLHAAILLVGAVLPGWWKHKSWEPGLIFFLF